jgi:UDP-glucose 4-epimerase
MMERACKGIDRIFHFASVPQTGKTHVDVYRNVSVVGTELLLRAFIASNEEDSKLRIVYSSSTSVYGYDRKGEILTEDSNTAPKNPYGESKFMTEEVIKAFAAVNSRITYTIFRIAVMYGPGYDYGFEQLFRLIKDGRMRIIGNGDNHLTLVNEHDVAEIAVIAADNENAANRVYNLSDGISYTQRGVLQTAAKLLGTTIPEKGVNSTIAKLAAKAAGVDGSQMRFLLSDRVLSIERIKKELGFTPKRSIYTEGKALVEEFNKDYSSENR